MIDRTKAYVEKTLEGAEGGHDKWHAYNVWELSRRIAKGEGADLLTVELGALLHDIADPKFYNGDENVGPGMAEEFLSSLGIDGKIINDIINIILNISFKGEDHVQKFKSLELSVVQDADRLTALGAIGIARVFSYGGYARRPIYDPNIPPIKGMNKEEYKRNTSPSINHFYEKLLLLKDKMNTNTGRKMAEERHQFMKDFLEIFYLEWEGEV